MTVYKLVRIKKDGNCYPLFIDKNKPFIFDKWMKAEFHPTKGFAPRSLNGFENPTGGWHCCFTCFASHLSEELKTGEKRVWIECESKGDSKTYKRSLIQGGDWILVEYLKPLRIVPIEEVRQMQEEFMTKHNLKIS